MNHFTHQYGFPTSFYKYDIKHFTSILEIFPVILITSVEKLLKLGMQSIFSNL